MGMVIIPDKAVTRVKQDLSVRALRSVLVEVVIVIVTVFVIRWVCITVFFQ